MGRVTMRTNAGNPQAGMSMIEVMIATVILSISSLGVIGLVWTSILMNNRNKVDSTQTMLAESIIEQVNATIIGSENSALSDCDGTTWTISTTPGGADLSWFKHRFFTGQSTCGLSHELRAQGSMRKHRRDTGNL